MKMIKHCIAILYLTFLVFTSMAQGQLAGECSAAKLIQLPGTWKAGPQGSVVNVTAADLTKEKAVLASVRNMVSENYNPMGCEVNYSTVFSKYPSAGQTFIADPYHLAMYILRFLCDGNSTDKSKYYVDVSTPTTVNIAANAIHWLDGLYAANIPEDDFRGYLKLEKRPKSLDGYFYFGEKKINYNEEIYEKRWLITYDGSLPFSYINRKEYLQIQKARIEKSIKDSPSQKEYYQQFLNNINAYLSKPETELSQDAICMWNEEERFERFVDEGTSGSFIAVKPNLAYYNKNLPKSSPQFFTVVYKISKGDPIFESNMAAIEKAVDFAKLQEMLGK
jgi:hypothetical protein